MIGDVPFDCYLSDEVSEFDGILLARICLGVDSIQCGNLAMAGSQGY